MEGKKSFVDELFPGRDVAQQTKSDILSSIFPPRSMGAGKDFSHCDASGSCRKHGDGNFRSNQSKNHNTGKKYSNPVYLCELPESCLMSSSVYYGGRDDFISDPSISHNSSTHYASYKKDKDDDSGNTDAATRGDWWQGSFYY